MLAHMVDLAIWYFGPPRTVETLICELRCPRRLIAGVEYPVDAEDYVLVRMISRSGVEMLLQADLVTPSFSQLIEIQGDNGSLIASIQQEIPSRLFLLRSAAGFAAGYTALPSMESSPFEMQMNDFLDLVRNPDRSPRCSFDDAVHTMRALDMIRARADLK